MYRDLMNSFLTDNERSFLEAVSSLAFCNPFLSERTTYERSALGSNFVEGEPAWSMAVDNPDQPRVNVWRIFERLEPLIHDLRSRLEHQGKVTELEMALYEDGVLHLLYQRYYHRFLSAGFGPDATKADRKRWRFYSDFLADWEQLFQPAGLSKRIDPAHTFAFFRQIQRAFEQIFIDIIGSSTPAAQLRGAIWESIFTHDLRRYRRTLYARMGDFATLITGPSGTGKELAARAIAQSRYIPFDPAEFRFADDATVAFFPINISALSPALVESELFGHRRGSFTGAIGDRKGWLETCPPLGSVFLDEIGDLDPAIQVKLLRVIETKSFHPVGDTSRRQFQGKLIAATNRNLEQGIRSGSFREDLYYRLCSDQITTPSLAKQLANSPRVMRELVVYMATRVAGAEAEELVPEIMAWIEQNLRDYHWPGNYRELEQCVRNMLIRRNYRPSQPPVRTALEECLEGFREGRLTADALLSRYCTIVYSKTASYEEAARRLDMDRRTVKSKVDRDLLERLQRE
jgi:transcriptional regulator with AAA-type ATPase domain